MQLLKNKNTFRHLNISKTIKMKHTKTVPPSKSGNGKWPQSTSQAPMTFKTFQNKTSSTLTSTFTMAVFSILWSKTCCYCCYYDWLQGFWSWWHCYKKAASAPKLTQMFPASWRKEQKQHAATVLLYFHMQHQSLYIWSCQCDGWTSWDLSNTAALTQ